ncbi:unnamed protein product [Adineta steineri]|uniref:Uncharacterized protein n=1 Tax=Adineta steineri TaxID=433720 RepID=A0A813P7H5_9BILA|nr:unnamed protein product [Adineta steineri]
MCCNYLFLLLFIGLSYGDQCKVNNRTDFFRSKSGSCVSCLSHCNYQTNVCLYPNQLRGICSSMYYARNIRECQHQLTPDIVHSFLRSNQSNLFDHDKNNDEPVCLFCGNFTRGHRCEYCRQRPNGKQLSHLIELKSQIATCFECSCSGQTYDCRTNIDQPLTRIRSSDLFDPIHQSISFSLSDYRAIHLTTGSLYSSIKTHGFIKIYQSRMNIDLFVFFSVFFSSFFLFLSIGICFWKVKFAYEIHRRRRTLKHEYHKRMARPFAKIQLFIKPSTIISNDDEENFQQLSSPVVSSSVDIPLLLPSTRTDIDYSPHVVSVEPLRDQNNCYTTLLFHLPGDLSTQYRLCAGTTLAQLPSDYSNALSNARMEAELQKRNRRRKKYNGQNTHKPKVIVKKTTANARHHQQQQQRRRKHHHHRQQQQQQQQLLPPPPPQQQQPRTTVEP